jgi:DNA-binding MarR family transcriptional regulator
MVLARAFLEPEIESRLLDAATLGSRLVVDLTLDDIDSLEGCVAGAANHCDNGRIRRLLNGLFDRLTRLQDRFTDEAPLKLLPAAVDVGRGFTGKQGQYLAFIYYFTKIHGVSPAESDLQKFFKVSPSAVHAMILTLERRGFVERTAGKARSIRLLVRRADIPELE